MRVWRRTLALHLEKIEREREREKKKKKEQESTAQMTQMTGAGTLGLRRFQVLWLPWQLNPTLERLEV